MKGRITSKKLVEWCNEQFKKFEINNYIVTNVRATRFRPHDYEGGACRLYITFQSTKDKNHWDYFLCFYSMKELKRSIDLGYTLYLKDNGRRGILSEFEIELKK